MTSKGRSKKNPVKEIANPQPKKAEVKKQNDKEQNAVVQEDSPKAKNVKNAKKGNAKKAAPKRRLFTEGSNDVEVEETAEAAEAEEAATLEADIKENGEAHSVKENEETQPKQKKRNAGKANMAINGKVEAKGKPKKGQAAAIVSDEEEAIKDVTAENKTTETNAASEIDENGVKDVSSSGNDSVAEIDVGTNDSTLPLDASLDPIKDEVASEANESNEVERSGSFLCY